MLEQDYIMRLIQQLIQAMIHAVSVSGMHLDEEYPDDADVDGVQTPDPLGAAQLLEISFGECIGMDQEPLLALSPESFAGVLQISGVDRELVHHLVKCLQLESEILEQAAYPVKAELRASQAAALAAAYGIDGR